MEDDDLLDLVDLEDEEEDEEEPPQLVEAVCTGLVCIQKRSANMSSALKASESETCEKVCKKLLIIGTIIC